METEHLREIGLTDNEIRVYLELLKKEDALASELSNKTNINRTLIYQILNNLLKKGIISYVIKNNVKYFKASHPSRLLDFLKERESNIKNLIPELLNLTAPSEKKYSVELYEGKEGLKTILGDIVRTKPKEWLDITSGMTIEVLQDYVIDKWEKQRIKARIKARIIINDTDTGRKRGKQLEKLKITETRYMPKGLMSPSHIYVYGNRVAITLWVKNFPFGILIKSQEIADRFKEFFEWFWKIAKK
ncbi:MAG: helix-turn-helix domain-containing protein [Candidatus Nanoarchaeia archaeon]|nr:helix-turn-helix domain-containing protein [Candidatus Nanoarchaeia archaeon]MDD5741026.1 helix-turn-helix domain-containing protein [Candidatus Nanoarchaeia archaeon]